MIPFQLHRHIPLVRRPFYQRDRAMQERDKVAAERDAAILEQEIAALRRNEALQERADCIMQKDRLLAEFDSLIIRHQVIESELETTTKALNELVANQAVPIDALPDEVCLQQTPTSQAAIDLISGWISDIPGVKAGEAKLFDDGRAKWALDHLGSVDGHSVLELGPLEAGHTSMLHNAGATITAIEANKRAFVKCLIVKEILRLDRAHFLLGDFMPWLVANTRHFDLVWMTGVLYHMTDPVRLLRLAASCTDRLHLWTHYVPDDFDHTAAWAAPIIAVEDRLIEGRSIRHYVRTYRAEAKTQKYCGGVEATSVWLGRAAILLELQQSGFTDIEIGFETQAHPHGPCFAIVAKRRNPKTDTDANCSNH